MRELAPADRDEVGRRIRESWGSTRMATRGRLHEIPDLPGFVAHDGTNWLGLAAYHVEDGRLEVALLESFTRRIGVGGALLAGCVDLARRRTLARVWLVSTNDNTDALRFYQRHGFVLTALHCGAVADARRRLKPEIPELGAHGIPIRDELELELPPDSWSEFVERYAWPS